MTPKCLPDSSALESRLLCLSPLPKAQRQPGPSYYVLSCVTPVSQVGVLRMGPYLPMGSLRM